MRKAVQIQACFAYYTWVNMVNIKNNWAYKEAEKLQCEDNNVLLHSEHYSLSVSLFLSKVYTLVNY